MVAKIQKVRALEILDSRGDPTVEVEVTLDDTSRAIASVPSGASTGMYEAFELRDGDIRRYGGKGVTKAVAHVNDELNALVRGYEATDQKKIDDAMIAADGTATKSRLGANAILGVSLAVARAASVSVKQPLYQYLRSLTGVSASEFILPTPLINVVNGGKHASNNLDIQEFWIIPQAEDSFMHRLQQGTEVFQHLGRLLRGLRMDTDLGNEGGYAPDFQNHQEVFDLLQRAIRDAGYDVKDDIALGLDAGSSVLYDTRTKKYRLALEDKSFTTSEFIDFWMRMADKYELSAMEDPIAEEDWDGWQEITQRLQTARPATRLIGDDVFVTNVERFRQGIERHVANSILIKPNQIGTLSETFACIQLAREHDYQIVISHRSGETTDTFIADLAVAVSAEMIKTGATARGERTAKYNRLIEIESELNEKNNF